jgi:hypothetical protein
VFIIFMILFALYDNFKYPVVILVGVVLTVPVGALLALKLTGTAFSASSALGLLALIGVSVETAVILVSYINKLRIEQGMDIRTATREASLLRLRRMPGTAACGTVDRHRFRHAEAVCHRNRGRVGVAAISGLLCKPSALPDCGAGGRCAEGLDDPFLGGSMPQQIATPCYVSNPGSILKSSLCSPIFLDNTVNWPVNRPAHSFRSYSRALPRSIPLNDRSLSGPPRRLRRDSAQSSRPGRFR